MSRYMIVVVNNTSISLDNTMMALRQGSDPHTHRLCTQCTTHTAICQSTCTPTPHRQCGIPICMERPRTSPSIRPTPPNRGGAHCGGVGGPWHTCTGTGECTRACIHTYRGGDTAAAFVGLIQCKAIYFFVEQR